MDGTYFMLPRSACVLSMKPLDILGISLLLSTVLLGKESLTNEQKIGHVLNRVAYGPSPEDLERVRNNRRRWWHRQLWWLLVHD